MPGGKVTDENGFGVWSVLQRVGGYADCGWLPACAIIVV